MRVPKVVGERGKQILRRGWDVLVHTRSPLVFVGPTGSGKTLIGLNLLKAYEKKFGVPSYYLQLGPDVSRTTLVGGFRLVDGSLVPVKGVVMRAMDEGGIVFLDEFTHAHPEDQVSLNSALANDEVKIVGIGEITSRAKPTTRFIVAHNPTSHHGNFPLPLAIRRRAVAIQVDYPGEEDETEIAMSIAERLGASVPRWLVRFLTRVVISCRDEENPICASNVANAAILILREARRRNEPPEIPAPNEAVLRGLFVALTGREPTSVEELQHPHVRQFVGLVATLGVDTFTDLCMSAMMGPYLSPTVRDRLVASLRVEVGV